MSYPDPEGQKPRTAARRMPFRPPQTSPLVIRLCSRLLPRIMLRGYGIHSIGYRDAELRRLEDMSREHRVLITPNHPTHAEPVVLFHLSRQIETDFYYLSNRESFDRYWGLFGWLLTRSGAYSILRGVPDRESFKFTRKVLAERIAPLVIFPEGEVYSQNDSLLPFQAGVFQLAFLALDDLKKTGKDRPVYVQPTAIRYRFIEDMGQAIVDSLRRLEIQLGLAGPPPGDTYLRLRRIGDAVLTATEKVYRLPAGGPEDLNPRIDAVRGRIVERVAEALDLELDSLGKTLPDQMRALINRVNRVVTDEGAPESDYQERLLREEADRIRPLNQDLKRLSNWVAVRDGYVAEQASQERMVDTLWRLESEVLERRVIEGKREGWVRLAEPIDLREYADSPRKEAIREVTTRVESEILQLLNEMASSD